MRNYRRRAWSHRRAKLAVGPLPLSSSCVTLVSRRAEAGTGMGMLVRCVVYKNGRKFADIDASEIHLYINQPDCFVWVALFEPDAAALEQMQREFNLHPLAIEDARHGHQRPKFEEYGEALFAVVHMIEEDARRFACRRSRHLRWTATTSSRCAHAASAAFKTCGRARKRSRSC